MNSTNPANSNGGNPDSGAGSGHTGRLDSSHNPQPLHPAAVERAEKNAAGSTGTRNSFAVTLAGSPIVLGTLITAAFYAAIYSGGLTHPLLIRYFCGHPLEYVTAAFFFTGLATLLQKAWRLRAEHAVFARTEITQPQFGADASPAERAASLSAALAELPPTSRRTLLAQRLCDVCRWIQGRNGNHGLEEHLKYLAELAAENVHRSYALVRTITWAVPILGFLGTVIGITLAIANVTPEQLESSLGDVTGGLAVAFDTTALSLALSMILVFCSFWVERSEQSVLADVERFGIRGPAEWFADAAAAETDPFTAARQQLAEDWRQKMESVLAHRLDVFDAAAEKLQQRWAAELSEHQQRWRLALDAGVRETMHEHSTLVADLRKHWLAAAQQQTVQLGTLAEQFLNELTRRQQQWLEAEREAPREFARQAAELSDRFRSAAEGLVAAVDSQTEHSRQLAQLQQAAQQQLSDLTEALRRLSEDAGTLTDLESRLNENLAALRETQTFEDTLNSLSAAIQLLAARTRPHAA